MTSTETPTTQGPPDQPPDRAAPTQPPDRAGKDSRAPAIGWRAGLRFVWTQLTSMRTALVLLFLLALAAIPGSLVPQRAISPIRVQDFITAHPVLGPIYDRIGMFDVYSSPWFSAIYLLLFVSLIGCIIPRIGAYTRALRTPPPRTPRNLSRLPAYASRSVDGDAAHLLDRAEADLKAARYRVVRTADAVSAERGYLREAGNLVFHLSLLALLIGVAINGLFGFRGTSVVVAGQGFSNTLTQYDDLTAGAAFREQSLEPFTVLLQNFEVKFETGPVQRGAARVFRADVELTLGAGGTPKAETIEVNHPLSVNGTTVHLIAHGYAPRVTVRDGDGNVAFSGPVVFLPQDGNFMSAGVIKAPDGQPRRLAFQGLFLPTAVVTDADSAPVSAFPDALNPALLLDIWSGPPKAETGRPENVYSLDTSGLTQAKKENGQPVRFALQPGDTYDLPDGLGSVTMDGWDRWVKLQIGDTPGMPIAIGSIAMAVLGLCLSLFIRPRRVWVRVRAAGSDAASGADAGADAGSDAVAGPGGPGSSRLVSLGSSSPPSHAPTVRSDVQGRSEPVAATSHPSVPHHTPDARCGVTPQGVTSLQEGRTTTACPKTPEDDHPNPGAPCGEEHQPSRVVEVGGLDRADARAGLIDDVIELADRLVGAEPGRGGR